MTRVGVALAFVLSLFYPGLAESFRGRVVGISDGDTIRVLRGNDPIRVRLYGIDAPERKQPFGTRARQYAGDLAYSKVVRVDVRDRDRNGRTVANVILPDGRDLSGEMARAGLAWWFRRYAPHDKDLARLERDARNARRGLWGDVNPVPPWEFRRR